MTYIHRVNLDDPKHLKRVPGFVYQCFPILAHVRGNSASEILAKLKENREYQIYGEHYRGHDILRLWRFFYETNPSDYLPLSQTKCCDISAGVPLVMLAYRHQHDTPYEHWRGDPNTRFMMNKRIEWICDSDLDLATKWPGRVLQEYQQQSLGDKPATSYKCMATGDAEFDKLPQMQRFFLLQTWIYHPSVRSPNMITHLGDWDVEGEALYSPQLNLKPKEEDPWGVEAKGTFTFGSEEPW